MPFFRDDSNCPLARLRGRGGEGRGGEGRGGEGRGGEGKGRRGGGGGEEEWELSKRTIRARHKCRHSTQLQVPT